MRATMAPDANMAANLGRIRSAIPGIAFPALPDEAGSLLLAMQAQLGETQWWPPGRIERCQLEQFSRLYRHAVETVPFYARRFGGHAAPKVFSMEDYRRLPMLTRAEVQAAGDEIVSKSVPRDHGGLRRTESSGSTARPLVTIGTDLTHLVWRTLLLREHVWHGRDLGGKLAAIRSKTGTAALEGWGAATDAAFCTGPAAITDISVDLDEQLRWLKREDPDYLISYGTNVHLLARRSHELGMRLPGLREVRTFGETLRPDTRDLVRAAWGVGLVDVYSAEELGYMALQCPGRTSYHVQSESVILEVLRDDGTPCAPGEIGRVAVSSLHNFAMPLIRYASGDYAEAGPPCPCGRGLPVLTRVAGRQRNMLVRPDGSRHWPSFPSEAWRHVAPVDQMQLTQTSLEEIVARVVARRTLTQEEKLAIAGALQETLRHPFRISVEEVAEIPRRGYKYEDFISEIV